MTTRCTRESPREACLRETEKAPIKTGWAETDQGTTKAAQCAREVVAREYMTHARPELYASTPPLEALKVLLSEIATGERTEKVVALVEGVWQGCINGKHIVTTVHGDDITIGGERSVVELLLKMISRKYDIKKTGDR